MRLGAANFLSVGQLSDKNSPNCKFGDQERDCQPNTR